MPARPSFSYRLSPARRLPQLVLILILGQLTTGLASAEGFDAAAGFQQRCAECHGSRRYGGYAPPLIPETLRRKSDEVLLRAILEGLPNTQMPAFAAQLGDAQARAILDLLREPIAAVSWSLEDIMATRIEEPARAGQIAADVDRENLIFVVERGSGSVVVLDGDRMVELDRFAVGRIHGGIKFDRKLHQALAVTRDGTLVDYDLDLGAPRTRIKVGVNTRNIAVSGDGKLIAAVNQLPQSLIVLDGRLHPLRLFPLPGQPSAVYQVPGAKRFLLTLRDLPHLYFVDQVELDMRHIVLSEPFEDFVFVPGKPWLVASSRAGQRLVLYDHVANEILGSLATEGLPHLFSASFFEREGALYAAFNHMGAPRLSIVDMESFEIAREIPLLGAGYFTRTHTGTPFLWIDSNTESIQLVDKASLELVGRVLTPSPGKKAMHVEFTSDGARALVSVWAPEGAVVVYDSTTLEEEMRLPFAMPVGKYNAANKIRALR
jgi:hypothetical protein